MKRTWTQSRKTWDPIPIRPLVNSTSEEMQGVEKIKPAGCLQPAFHYSQGATSQGFLPLSQSMGKACPECWRGASHCQQASATALGLVWGLNQFFSNSNEHMNYPGILLKCRFRFRRSAVQSESCISNKLPGNADVPGLQTKCGEVRI